MLRLDKLGDLTCANCGYVFTSDLDRARIAHEEERKALGRSAGYEPAHRNRPRKRASA